MAKPTLPLPEKTGDPKVHTKSKLGGTTVALCQKCVLNSSALQKQRLFLRVHDLFALSQAPDLFDELCPVAVHQALAAFDVRKGEVVNAELARLKEAVNMTNQLLSSMNLPAAIEDTSGSSVPGSLVSKANLVKDAGGMSALAKLIADLPDLLTRNTEILDECERMLKEERESDAQLKNQVGHFVSSKLGGSLV